MMGKCLFQCPRIKRIRTTMNWLFIVTHKLVSMFLLEISKQQNHKCLCYNIMIIKFICSTIHCFFFHFVANSKVTDSSDFYNIMIIEFIHSTIARLTYISF